MPPLRERKDDIPVLVEHFLRHFTRNGMYPAKALSPEAYRARSPSYAWPGNVRELENVIERLVVTGAERGHRRRRPAAGDPHAARA